MTHPLKLTSITDFRGGLNLRADPFELRPNETPDCLNVDFDARGGLQMRRGVKPETYKQLHPNLLTLSEASAKSDTTGWSALTNCVFIGRVSPVTAAYDDTATAFDSVAAGNMTWRTGLRGSVGVPVVVGTTYKAFADMFADSVARDARISIRWLNSGGGTISESHGTTTALPFRVWTTVSVSAAAPAGAVTAQIIFTAFSAGGAGERFLTDGVYLGTATNTVWVRPGAGPNAIDRPIKRVHTFESGATKQLLIHAEDSDEGTLWKANLGSDTADVVGVSASARSFAYNGKLYFVRGLAGQQCSTWNGTAETNLAATPFNDDLTTPVGGVMPLARFGVLWRNFAIIAYTRESSVDHPSRLRFSHVGQIEDWRSTDFIDIDKGESGNDEIVGLAPLGDRLLIFKRRSIHALVGDGPDTFAVYPVTTELGAVSQDAIVGTDVGVFFYSWPDGVFLYTGTKLDWKSKNIHPLVEGGQVPGDKQELIRLGWSGRRLWVSVPWRVNASAALPAKNTRVFVLDPTLSKEGSWTAYDLSVDYMLEWRPLAASSRFLGVAPDEQRVLNLEPVGDPLQHDDVGAGAVHIASHWRTPWIVAGEPVVKKRWKRPEYILRDVADAYTVKVELFTDFDPSLVRRTHTVTTDADGSYMDWGDNWGELWGPAPTETDRNVIRRGPRLGTARAVQLKINGPATTNAVWGLNSVTLKYLPKPPRS